MPPKYDQHYKKSWESLPAFKGWLRPVENESTKASCAYSRSEFYVKISDIKKHATTTKHKKSSEPYCSSQQKKLQFPAATESSCGKSEAGLCLFICAWIQRSSPLTI
ncbi:unnamed protein product [Ixodes pacificus]